MRCIEDELPFEIPDSWAWVKVDHIFQQNTGKALNSSNREGTELEYITTSNLYWDYFQLEKPKKMFFKDSEVEKCTVRKGDFLVCEGGDVGRAAIWNFDYNIRIQNHIHRLRSYSEVSTKFYYYLFYYYKQSKRIGGKGIGVQGLSSNALGNLLFPLPPLSEQYRIVAKLQELEPLIEKYRIAEEQLYELNSNIKDQLKKSILQYAIEGKLVPQDPNDKPASVLLKHIREEKQRLIKEGKIKKDKNESIIFRKDNSYYEKFSNIDDFINIEVPFEIPDGWEWSRFHNLYVLTSGQDLPTSKFNESQKGTVYLTGASNIEYDKIIINRWTTEPRSVAYFGDLLLTCKGTVGKLAFLNIEKAHIARQIMSISTPFNLNLNYLKLILEFNIITLRSKAKSMIPGISRDDVLSILIPLPPLYEQERIVEKFNHITHLF